MNPTVAAPILESGVTCVVFEALEDDHMRLFLALEASPDSVMTALMAHKDIKLLTRIVLREEALELFSSLMRLTSDPDEAERRLRARYAHDEAAFQRRLHGRTGIPGEAKQSLSRCVLAYWSKTLNRLRNGDALPELSGREFADQSLDFWGTMAELHDLRIDELISGNLLELGIRKLMQCVHECVQADLEKFRGYKFPDYGGVFQPKKRPEKK